MVLVNSEGTKAHARRALGDSLGAKKSYLMHIRQEMMLSFSATYCKCSLPLEQYSSSISVMPLMFCD